MEDADFLPLLKFVHYFNNDLHYDPEDTEKPEEWRTIETAFLHRLEFEGIVEVNIFLPVLQVLLSIDEFVESILAERKQTVRKLKEFKYTFPNLSATVLNIIKVSNTLV